MKTRYLLDSFALLAYLKKEDNYDKVKKSLHHINIGETFYILARERSLEEADYFYNVILPISHFENTLHEVIEASKIKAKYPISYADCFAVATACKERATIITGDPEFKLVEKLVNVEWM